MNKKIIAKYLPFALIFFATIIFYSDSFNHFFYQDDIWHFYISKASSAKDFFDFFNPINKFGYQTYRPLSTQVFFFLFEKFFGINHLFFQLIAIAILSVNSFLIFKILRKYSDLLTSSLLTLFYIVHHQNIGIIYYLSTIQISFALFFTLLAIREIQEKKHKWEFRIVLYYILGIFCQEISLLNSIIFISLLLMEDVNYFKKYKRLFLVLISLTISYIAFRFYFVNQQIFDNTHYQVSLQVKSIVNNLFWYVMWMLSVPEYVINFVSSGFKPLPPLFGQYRTESIVSILVLLTNILLLSFCVFKSLKNKKLFVYLFCFTMALAPILIFPWHKYVYYLPIASVFVLIFIGKVFTQKRIYYPLIILMIASAIISNLIDRKTSYNYKRGIMSAKFMENIDWKTVSNGKKTILVANDPTFEVFSTDWGSTSSQAKIVLKEGLFFKLIGKNDQLETVYEDDVENISSINYDYKIVAKKEW